MNSFGPELHGQTRDLPRRLAWLEVATLVHVGVFLAAATWAFGGNAAWVKEPLAIWGSLGALITLSAVVAGRKAGEISLRPLRRLWPFALYNALAVLSWLTPGLRQVHSGADTLLAPLSVPGWRPSAAMPAGVLPALLLFDAIYIACFNLLLVVRRRRAFRAFLLFVAANALLLAVFGTAQKLSGATGLFFGRVKSPQSYFFSTFIYHNHWGAFMVLMASVCLALAVNYRRHANGRGPFGTPAFGVIVTLAFLVASVPLSGSRSNTVLLAILVGTAFVRWLAQFLQRLRRGNEPVAIPLAACLAAAAGAVAAVWFLDQDVIIQRFSKTEEQISDMRAADSVGSRGALYRDTWRMAEDKIWFGWGTASYPHVFMLYNTQEPDRRDRLPKFYHDAHSDWLQALAEHGIVGTALLGLCGLVPLFGVRRGRLAGSLPFWLLGGCALVLLYAWVEFPFGNVAVVLSWWLCFFCAAGYADLNADSPDRSAARADPAAHEGSFRP